MGWLWAGVFIGGGLMTVGYCDLDSGDRRFGAIVLAVGTVLFFACLFGIRSAYYAELETETASQTEREADPATVETVEGPATVLVIVAGPSE